MLNKKIIILAVSLAAISIALLLIYIFSTHHQNQTTPSNKFYCPPGLTPFIVNTAGSPQKISCSQEPPPNDGLDYLIGTGTQIYTLIGYYTEHDVHYYGEDYDPTRDQVRIFTCKSFVVTSGNQDFINAYNKRVPQIDNRTIINFSGSDIYDFKSSFLTTLLNSNENNQLSLKIKVGELPGRGALPCEYWGVNFLQ